jgi:hypothetical protein
LDCTLQQIFFQPPFHMDGGNSGENSDLEKKKVSGWFIA